MKTIVFLLLSSICAISQCQPNPNPNPSDPFDPKTVCVGPLATLDNLPGAYRFKIGSPIPMPKIGFTWVSTVSGKLAVSENGQPYRILASPIQNMQCPVGQFVYGFFGNVPLCRHP